MADEEMITFDKFSSRTPNDRITINQACYFVRELYDQIINLNGNVPHTNLPISNEDKERLIAAYNILLVPEEPKQYDNIEHLKKNIS